MNLSQNELSKICYHLRQKFPSNIIKIFGGNIHNAWKLDFPGCSVFIKKNIRKKKLLKFEQHCLKNLIKYTNPENLIVPKVLGYLFIQNAELLILEWIDLGNYDQCLLGKGLAELHLKSQENTPESFGYPINGFIGTSNQIQGWDANWGDFFINYRLEPQLNNLKNNPLGEENLVGIKSQIKRKLFGHQPIKSLVHGDLWSGNIGIDRSNKGVIYDPACWWADPEVDISMSSLFGGFNQEFYEEYEKIIPKEEGYEDRQIIYNFYHILNHANMFGGIYLQQVNDYVELILNF